MAINSSSLRRAKSKEAHIIVRAKRSSLPSDVWVDIFVDLSREQLDTASITCNIFRSIISKRLAIRCLRHHEEVHIRAYDSDAYLLTATITSARGPAKYINKQHDIAEFLITRLRNCYIETVQVEYTHWLPSLIPKLAYNLDKTVYVRKLHFSNSRLHELPTMVLLDFFTRLASINAVHFDDALDAEQLSNELLAICSKKGVEELRSRSYPSVGTTWSPLHKLNEDGIIAFLFGNSGPTTPKCLAVGSVALGPHFINRLVEMHECRDLGANISLDVTQQYYRFEVTRWKRYLKSVPPEGGAVFDFPGPMRLQIAVIDDLLRIRRGATKGNDRFFFPY